MEGRNKQQANMLKVVSILVLVIGLYQLVFGVIMVVEQIGLLGTADGNAGRVALFVIMALLGLLGVAAAALGIMSVNKPDLTTVCKRIGFFMLIVASAFTVVNIVMLGGINLSYFLGLFSSICYLAMLK
ncbi:hypothetical protein LJC27_01590 [Christensenellaceae bacterium OttesenSCG-928-M15]|nr:hypothetical protein [Christensenellaceae bacterium OttesenSCG-928-M15]